MKAQFTAEVEKYDPGDEIAGISGKWTLVRKTWAKVTPLSGREYYQAQQVEATTTHRIETEYFAGANSRMRLIRPNVEDPAKPLRTFNVESVVNEQERNRKLIWMCEEVG